MSNEKLKAALQACVHQIEQMKGMFDDKDGTVQGALDDALLALLGVDESGTAPKERTYMVVGYYTDTGDRYATSEKASDGEEAERLALLAFAEENGEDAEQPSIAGTVFINDKGEMEIGS